MRRGTASVPCSDFMRIQFGVCMGLPAPYHLYWGNIAPGWDGGSGFSALVGCLPWAAQGSAADSTGMC